MHASFNQTFNMPILIDYIFKLFLSLAVVYLFYRFVLRKLTFYNCNRWYLILYSFACFLIPFININPVLENSNQAARLVNLIPSMEKYTSQIERVTVCPTPIWSVNWDKWDWALLVFVIGAGFLLVRFCIRFISFFRMRRNASLIASDKMKLYHVENDIIPFSFGNSIFINPRLHNESELKEIIRHEIVHVRQKHTLDIIWAELLCIINWYNPFSWMIRRAIRQNLEFIADRKVVENGLDKKEYQYLLLKVIGNNHFSISNQFNFSSLKKRIIMMNKMKSARINLLRFMFILPLVAIVLFAFRYEKKGEDRNTLDDHRLSADSIPAMRPNAKNYYLTVHDNNGECMVIVRDRNKKEVERVLLTKWNANEEYYKNLYGQIPPPPPPLPPGVSRPVKNGLPANMSMIKNKGNKLSIYFKDGSVENYDLAHQKEREAFETKYGKEFLLPPPPPIAPSAPNPPLPPSPTTIGPVPSPAKAPAPPSAEAFQPIPPPAPAKMPIPPTPPPTEGIMAMPSVSSGETIFNMNLVKAATGEHLNNLVRQAKQKDIDIQFTLVDVDNKNEIVRLAGTIQKGNSKSTFSISGFEVLNFVVTKENDQYACMVYSGAKSENKQ
jgi:beta-lactamase regulating signal transducer with metallopeptidase domain